MADPRYCVTVKFGIGLHVGEWTGKEEQMEEQYEILCQSPSKEYAELLYKRVCAAGRSHLSEGGEAESPRKPSPDLLQELLDRLPKPRNTKGMIYLAEIDMYKAEGFNEALEVVRKEIAELREAEHPNPAPKEPE